VNEARFGYIKLYNASLNELSGVRDVVKELGLPFSTPNPQDWGIPAVALLNNNGLSNFGSDSNGPFVLNDKIVQGLDNFSWVHGKHSLRFGGEYRWDVYNNYGNQFTRAQFTFGGQYTANPNGLVGGNSVADILLGTMSRTDLAIAPAAGDFKANSLAFYLDDTYKVTPKLTVTLGMRWEVVQPWTDSLQNEVRRLLSGFGLPIRRSSGRPRRAAWRPSDRHRLESVRAPVGNRLQPLQQLEYPHRVWPFLFAGERQFAV
jgi:outer membrane receptor protein involved in Fe transport